MVTLLLFSLPIGMAALIGLLGKGHAFPFLPRRLQPGTPIVYRVLESSRRPGRHAYQIASAAHGDSYLTNRYWRVEEVRPDGSIVARTPLMEQQILRPDDPNLRRANFLDRLRYAARFPYSV
ncbi:MAG TPA: hypothetical protein VGF73_10580 [Chthoniobacterales bacterium]|jgi:hypothetical protein